MILSAPIPSLPGTQEQCSASQGSVWCEPQVKKQERSPYQLVSWLPLPAWNLSSQWQHQAMGRDLKGSRDPRARDRCHRLALLRVDRHRLGEASQGQMSLPLPASAVNQDLRITTQTLFCPLTFPQVTSQTPVPQSAGADIIRRAELASLKLVSRWAQLCSLFPFRLDALLVRLCCASRPEGCSGNQYEGTHMPFSFHLEAPQLRHLRL